MEESGRGGIEWKSWVLRQCFRPIKWMVTILTLDIFTLVMCLCAFIIVIVHTVRKCNCALTRTRTWPNIWYMKTQRYQHGTGHNTNLLNTWHTMIHLHTSPFSVIYLFPHILCSIHFCLTFVFFILIYNLSTVTRGYI